MKKLFFAIFQYRRALACIALLLLATARMFAQDTGADLPPIDVNTLTPDTIFSALIEPIYSALIILFGYLGGYIPGVKKLSPFARVISFALVAGLGLYLYGVPVLKIGASYLLSSGLYVAILKNFFPSKKPALTTG